MQAANQQPGATPQPVGPPPTPSAEPDAPAARSLVDGDAGLPAGAAHEPEPKISTGTAPAESNLVDGTDRTVDDTDQDDGLLGLIEPDSLLDDTIDTAEGLLGL